MFLRNHWKIEVGKCHDLKNQDSGRRLSGLGARVEAEKQLGSSCSDPARDGRQSDTEVEGQQVSLRAVGRR